AESRSEGHECVGEKPVRAVDDHFLLHQAVTPDSRNRTYTVIGAGQLAVNRGHHVRVTAQGGGSQGPLAKGLAAIEGPERRLARLRDSAATRDFRGFSPRER